MRHVAIRHAGRRASSLAPLLLTLSLCFTTGIALAAAIGDQVELRTTHRAGVPFHNAPGGTPKFHRVPDGTVAAVIDVDRGGRWLQLRLPDTRTGWMAARYVGHTIAGTPRPSARSGPRPRGASRSSGAAAAWRPPIPRGCASAPEISAGFPAAARPTKPARTRPRTSRGSPAPSPG
jgi:hypothetical protein